MSALLDQFDLDVLMAARYAYYVAHLPFLPDHDYDQLEAEYERAHGRLPVGSEKKEDYPERVRALALYMMLALCDASTSGEELL